MAADDDYSLRGLFGSDPEDTEDRELFGSDPEDRQDGEYSLSELTDPEDSDHHDEAASVTYFHHPLIKGLTYAPHCLSSTVCINILSNITKEDWFDPFTNRNQAMRFGNLPHFLTPLIQAGRELLPPALQNREPTFDQMIANYYEPGQGLRHHVDLIKRFDDGIIVASISGTCIMEFRPAQSFKHESGGDVLSEEDSVIPILLLPGDVVCLSGPARWEWEHGIPERVEDEWEGRRIPRASRVSVTLRKLLPNALIMDG